ncbi:hypothetical protein GCM10012280_53230 [Wenjunlia tyrosinilytica]|uniref:Uncharacterized protein n=1 Tax=Wenjunlia tyrosinilytica TaxID=1544741 RepID=A0A917ZVC9_9ACTN|nr:hypothetical protein GCM10012280_53230 [Wenjunlia tyrosinilytica]
MGDGHPRASRQGASGTFTFTGGSGWRLSSGRTVGEGRRPAGVAWPTWDESGLDGTVGTAWADRTAGLGAGRPTRRAAVPRWSDQGRAELPGRVRGPVDPFRDPGRECPGRRILAGGLRVGNGDPSRPSEARYTP